MRKIWAIVSLHAALPAWSQQSLEVPMNVPEALGEGWAGFLNVSFLVNTLLTLTLAALLGALISYHPRHRVRADTVEEIEAPKVYILYAVIGAIIGILVVAYGYLVGFVVFGIGGLIRFRTQLTSANLTGRVILVTLIGLACGLDMPHVAVIATAFAYGLIYVLDTRITYRVNVHVAPDKLPDSAIAYRESLESNRCRVISVRQDPLKQRIVMLVVSPPGIRQEALAAAVASQVDDPLRGVVDWQSD